MQNTEDQDEGCLLSFLKFMGIAIGLSLVGMLLGIVFGGDNWARHFFSENGGASEIRVLFWFTVIGAFVLFIFQKKKSKQGPN